MTLTARTTLGFEQCGSLDGSAPLHMEFCAKPNTAFTKGVACEVLAAGNGTADDGKVAPIAATGQKVIMGIAQEAVTTTQNPAAAEYMVRLDVNPNSLYRVTFANHLDFAPSSAGTTTTLVYATLADTAEAYIGSLAYCYAGTNKGQTRYVSNYNDTTTVTFTKALSVATATTESWIVLQGDATAADGVHPGSYVTQGSTGLTIDVVSSPGGATQPTTGVWAVVAIHPNDEMMIVTPILHRFGCMTATSTY